MRVGNVLSARFLTQGPYSLYAIISKKSIGFKEKNQKNEKREAWMGDIRLYNAGVACVVFGIYL